MRSKDCAETVMDASCSNIIQVIVPTPRRDNQQSRRSHYLTGSGCPRRIRLQAKPPLLCRHSFPTDTADGYMG